LITTMDPFPVNMAVVPQQEYRVMHPCKRFTLALLWGLLGVVLLVFVVVENLGKIMQVHYTNTSIGNASVMPALNLTLYYVMTNDSRLE
jgi:hypothetical protein